MNQKFLNLEKILNLDLGPNLGLQLLLEVSRWLLNETLNLQSYLSLIKPVILMKLLNRFVSSIHFLIFDFSPNFLHFPISSAPNLIQGHLFCAYEFYRSLHIKK